MSFNRSLLTHVVVFFLGIFVALAAAHIVLQPPRAQARDDGPSASAPANPRRAAAQRILPSAVSIVAGSSYRATAGSGFIIDNKGHVMTNNHVVKDHSEIIVILADKRRYKATVVGVDAKTDLAVLRIPIRGLKPVRWGDSDALRAGDDVLAVGNPFGFLSHTVTAGIVSATGRDRIGVYENAGAYAYEDFIQTDAIINPGNSGGPLVNIRGEVVGVNSAMVSDTGISRKIGLAIPSSVAIFVAERLIKDGKVVRGLLGASVMDLDYDLARALKLGSLEALRRKLKVSTLKGVYIMEISGQPARDANLKSGDLVTAIDGVAITDTNQFRFIIAKNRPKTIIKMTVIRNGGEIKVSVKLGTQPD